MLKVGIIGYGTIGKYVANAILNGQTGQATLSALLVRDTQKAENESLKNCFITADADAFFNQGLDLVLEAAGHHAVELYGEQTLRSGSDLIIVSMGSFSNQNLFDRLKQVASEAKKQMILPSAAIAGLDRISAATHDEIDEITLTSRKPPNAWYGTIAEEKVDLENIKNAACIFKGSARESARLFPESVNVSAALSLAGIGFERTQVQVFVDPTITKNTHEIYAKGVFGECRIQVSNTPSLENPKTSDIVSMSAIKVIKNQTEPIICGI